MVGSDDELYLNYVVVRRVLGLPSRQGVLLGVFNVCSSPRRFNLFGSVLVGLFRVEWVAGLCAVNGDNGGLFVFESLIHPSVGFTTCFCLLSPW